MSHTPLPINRRLLLVILAGLAMVGPFSVDTYLPSFRDMAVSLQVDEIYIQQTLSAYLFAFALMMLFHGTLTDTFGRRKVILVALTVYSFASLAAAFAPNLHALLLLRAVQGMSAGAGVVVGRAIVRDLMSGVEAQRMLAHITMVFAIGPAIAPLIGGWLQTAQGWRAVFVFLTLVGVLLWTVVYMRLPESLPVHARQPLHLPTMLRNYAHALRNLQFLFLSFALGLSFSGFALYVASAPDLIMNVLHLPETAFAWLFIPLVAGQVGGAWMTARMAHTAAPGAMVRRAYLLMACGAALNIGYNLAVEAPTVPWVTLPLIVYTLGVAMLMPNITLRILDLFPHTRGLAASLQAFIQTSLFAITSAIAPIAFGSALKLAIGLCLCASLSALSYAVALYARAKSA
ncbi:MAG TPA: multidrug effflux MFS transporter [Burkholderiales bacterium]|nr:multidrug effflux MFS transporter [Burkholderiales bacterium]